MSAGPIAENERVELLDVLRGFAVFGILVANMNVFSGYFLSSPEQAAALPTAPTDGFVSFMIGTLVDGKFYSAFSFLFGLGFAIQMAAAQRRGTQFVPQFVRRLAGLALIGFIHATLIWSGDILFVYALMGFLLVPFRDRPDRTLIRWGVGLLALPVAVYVVMLAMGMPDPFAGETGARAGPSILDRMRTALSQGNYFEFLYGNAINLAGRWMDLFLSVRFPKVLGLFLLGFCVGRRGMHRNVDAHLPLLRALVGWGLTIGLIGNVVLTMLEHRGVYLPASPLGLLQTFTYAWAVPLLAFGYLARLTLLHRTPEGQKRLRPLGYVGRMALTNYLMHSVISMAIFNGFGLRLYGRVGPTVTVLIAIAIFLTQIAFSRAWLQHYSFGPVEWVWRQMTYGRRMPLRRASPLDPLVSRA